MSLARLLNLRALPTRAPLLYRCRQGRQRVVCGLGHHTLAAAERCCARHNRELDAIGLLDADSTWIVEYDA